MWPPARAATASTPAARARFAARCVGSVGVAGGDRFGEPARPGHLGAERRPGGRHGSCREAPLVVHAPAEQPDPHASRRRSQRRPPPGRPSDPRFRPPGPPPLPGARPVAAGRRRPSRGEVLPTIRGCPCQPARPRRSSTRTRPRSTRGRSSTTTAGSVLVGRARTERRSAVKRSNVRFWVSLLVLAFVAAFALVAAWHEIQTLFGV